MRRILIETRAPYHHRGFMIVGGGAEGGGWTWLRHEAATIDSPEGREARMREIQDRDPDLMILEISEVR